MTQGTRGKRTEGERVRAATLYATGVSLKEICDELRIDRRTLWEWRTRDETFQRTVDEVLDRVVKEAARGVRRLAPKVVDAFERGLDSTHRQQAMKVKALTVSDDGETLLGERIEKVDLEDNSLAVQTAKLVSERIPELAPRQQVDVDVDASERLAQLILHLGEDDGDDRSGARTPPPPPPPG